MNLERAMQLAYDLRPSASDKAVRAALPEIQELSGIEARHWKPRIARLMKDAEPVNTPGLYYQDQRVPPAGWMIADTAAVTLTTSQQVLWSVADLTPTFAGDWWPGRGMQLRCLGRITTPAGAGALTWQLGYGTASGTTGALATSAALAVTASQTNITFRFEGRIRCRRNGPGANAGVLFGGGVVESGVFTSTADKTLPASAPAEVTGLNLSTTSGIHLQALEASTTGGTITIHDLELVNTN
jgi:hypothetical protein